ncbi:hypothetical protein PGB90_003732 [Kerria lacca]
MEQKQNLKFTNFCYNLRHLFASLNRILHEIQNQQDESDIKAYLRTSKYNVYKDSHRNYPEISEINIKHRELCDVIERMKNAYQIQITLNLAVCFFNTVCVLFITISEYRANTDWTLWISGLLWVAYYVLRVIMICASAAAVIDQILVILPIKSTCLHIFTNISSLAVRIRTNIKQYHIDKSSIIIVINRLNDYRTQGMTVSSMMITMKVSDLTKFRGKKLVNVAIQIILILRKRHHKTPNNYFPGDGSKAENMVKTARRNTWTIIIFYVFLAVSSAVSSFNRIRLAPLWTFVVMAAIKTYTYVSSLYDEEDLDQPSKQEKVMDALPNDYYCTRMLYNVEIWIVLVTFVMSSKKLPFIVENLRQFASTQQISESGSIQAEDVRHIGQSHTVICRYVRQIHRTYRLQLLTETGIIVLNILLHTLHVLSANNHMLRGYSDIVYSCLWIVHFSGRLCTTCMLASKTVIRAKETTRVVLLLEDYYRIGNCHDELEVIRLTVYSKAISQSTKTNDPYQQSNDYRRRSTVRPFQIRHRQKTVQNRMYENTHRRFHRQRT